MIQLRIQKESDLYNRYDTAQLKINERVYHYLKSFCTLAQYEKHLHDTLQITTDSPIDVERFKKAVLTAVQEDLDEFDKQIAINNRRSVWGFIVGILLSVAGVLLSIVMDQVLMALISFFGTMALNDAVTIQTKMNPDIKRLKKQLDPFRDFELEVIQTDRNQSGETV